MSWTLAIPELVLACAGLVILVAGVIPKQETFFPISMAVIGALIVTGMLVLGQPEGGLGFFIALVGQLFQPAFTGGYQRYFRHDEQPVQKDQKK